MVGFGRLTHQEASNHEGLVKASQHGVNHRQAALNNIMELFYDWEPASQAFFFNNGVNFSVAAASIAGVAYVAHFRKVFPELLRLTGKMRTWSYMPAALAMTVPASLCGQLHQFIVNDIALQETPCSVCVETRATAYQVACGALLPWVAPLPGFILLGKEMSWKWVPHPRASWQEWGKMYYNIFNKSSKMLVGVTVVQMLVAGGLVWAETRDYWSVMDELERRIEEEDRLIEEKKRKKEEEEIFQ